MLPSPGQLKPVPVHLFCIQERGPACRFYLLVLFVVVCPSVRPPPAPFLSTGDSGHPVQCIFNPPFAGTALPEQAAPQLVRGESVIATLVPALKVEMQYKRMLLFGFT